MNHKLAVAVCMTLAIASIAVARADLASPSVAETSPLSKIEGAGIVCKDSQAYYAIELKGKRVWQADPGQTDEGLELKVLKIESAKAGTYDITGKLEFLGESQEMRLELRGADGSFTQAELTIKAKQDNGKLETMLKLPCESAEARK